MNSFTIKYLLQYLYVFQIKQILFQFTLCIQSSLIFSKFQYLWVLQADNHFK